LGEKSKKKRRESDPYHRLGAGERQKKKERPYMMRPEEGLPWSKPTKKKVKEKGGTHLGAKRGVKVLQTGEEKVENP